MSSRVTLSRRSWVRGLSLFVAAAPALAACGNGGIRPLYGATPSGAGLQERMAQVDVATIPGRVGQRIRNDLIFLSTGGGHPLPPTHRLEVTIRESVISTLVRIDGELWLAKNRRTSPSPATPGPSSRPPRMPSGPVPARPPGAPRGSARGRRRDRR